MNKPTRDGNATPGSGSISASATGSGQLNNPAPGTRAPGNSSPGTGPSRNPAHGSDARRLLRRFRAGVLGTHSLKYSGYPYGAAMPYCTDQQGRIIVLISHLAEHTRNVAHDRHVSFTVSPLHAALQQDTRATVLGEIAPCEDDAVAKRYLRYFPDSRRYMDIGGFRFHTIEPRHVRLIAGFGSLHWLPGAQVLAAKLPIAKAEAGIIDHMTADHHGNLIDYCRHFLSVETEQVQMIGIDCDGFDLRVGNDVHRIEFDTEIRDALAARAKLVSLANIARA